jgi:hypothetical protein
MDNAGTLLYIFTNGQDILLFPQQKNIRGFPARKKSGVRLLAKQGKSLYCSLPSSVFDNPLFSEEKKMIAARPLRFLVCLCLLGLVGSGCFYREPVRHLSSDICMITPNLTQQEVLASLGPPDQRQQGEQGEIWTYYQVKKSLLRKTPYVGEKLGSQDYEVATITFIGDTVSTCLYRAFNEEELKKSGTTISEPRAD